MLRGLLHAEDAEQAAAFLTEAALIYRFFVSLGEPAPPLITPARRPRARENGPKPVPDWDRIKQPEPDVEFDQRVSW